MNRIWRIGDSYKIIENGVIIQGVIVEVRNDGYVVEWSDGEQTIEHEIDPARNR